MRKRSIVPALLIAALLAAFFILAVLALGIA